MKTWHEKQGQVHRIVVELGQGAALSGWPYASYSREDLIVGEAKRFLTELKKAIEAAEKAMKPAYTPFWRQST